ncbi:hypothetical protein O6H91_01G045700 [Diphasiastrum complanatum]|uniref:Uncharacterized protein n=5 Tax=Diphasiastrum complanatum TaxID=34168 RepID=A0ACC2EQG6_DIPCM|nr:hypothetical protein O6H91_01G045700 [Diphasiastrum complanatum]KAJ7568722.1 hypothetical protein O6H91_01G045700 [Diphasiastrum complanatum]KAJ7568723.1 hypothetical protein O6H91_01G045700 [Diphasiastrum complanatum]KAJ7568724.1 hypothetical protein O6H91_01G045700 [Diphasiastrum complanatum]KAJ7568725.1 hypothetical protein O6H91_01G045700 [Diphasiastrum complanatum]
MDAEKLLQVDPYWILVINLLKHNFLLLLVTLVVIFLASASSAQRKSRKFLPPGPPGWPIVGNIFQVGPLPHRALAGFCRQYGPLVYLRIGSVHTITTECPQMIKELLCNQDEVFASRPRTAAAKLMAYDQMDASLAPYGAHWKLMKRVCMEHLLTTKRIASFQQYRLEEAQAMVHSVWAECKLGGKVINVREHLGSFTMNIVTRMLLGKRYFGSESMGATEAKEFRELMHAGLKLLGTVFVGDYLPFLKWFDFRGYQSSCKRMGKQMDDFYSSILDEHRDRLRQFGNGPQNFVDVMLKTSAGERKLNDTEMKALLQDMVVGGTDTASFTMEWCMAELIRNPKILLKAQEELDQLLEDGHTLQESDLPQLRYLKAAVKETLRLHPPGAFLIPHESIRETKIAGYFIPKNSLVLINIHGLGRNPDVWENPLQFMPERFMGDKVELRDAEFRLVPFGYGRRKCPGATLGQSMLLLGLGNLIHAFNWAPPPPLLPTHIDVLEAGGFTNPPATPLKALAIPRLTHHRY